MKTQNHVWVIEMKDAKGNWIPCYDCAKSKSKAVALIKHWKVTFSDATFRTRKYISAK